MVKDAYPKMKILRDSAHFDLIYWKAIGTLMTKNLRRHMQRSTLSILWASVVSCITDTTLTAVFPTYAHAVDTLMKQLITSSYAWMKAELSYIGSWSNS